MSNPPAEPEDRIEPLLRQAQQLEADGELTAATQSYLEVLKQDPTHLIALTELGRLAQGTGHVSAARSAYQQAVLHHPRSVVARVNLGHLFYEARELEAARLQYQAALQLNPELADAHQGLARVFAQLGDEPAAQPHRHRGFAAQPVTTRRYRGRGAPTSVLLLVSTRGGNIPTQQLLDTRLFATTAVYPEFFPRAAPLPAHTVVFNSIGDADLCAAELLQAEVLLGQTSAPVINPPRQVALTGRAATAARLATVNGARVPAVRSIPRSALLPSQRLTAGSALRFPLLLRSPGFHTGQHFLRVECAADFDSAAASLPGDALLLIDYLDARGRDGMTRKYRVMFIDGRLYPLHLAISEDWKVHYFSSAMDRDVAYRQEEQRFLEDMGGAVGERALRALSEIGERLGLDYAGIDFGLGPDGTLLVFEANATMVINPPGPEPIWDYRRAPIDRALAATRQMLRQRAAPPAPPA